MNSFYLQQFVKDSFTHNLHQFHEIKLSVMKYALNCVSWNGLKEIFHSVSWSFIKRQTSGTSSDNEWYNEWQQMTTSGTTSDKERQRVTASDHFG